MSNEPIFNQLVSEFAAKGAVYDEFVKWSAPAFVWDPSRPVVQLDKQTRRGVNITKNPLAIAPPLSESSKQMVDQVVKGGSGVDRLLQEYFSEVGKEFAAHHPLAVVTDMHTETNDDGSATVVFDAVQPITSVLPLSEKNTAQPME